MSATVYARSPVGYPFSHTTMPLAFRKHINDPRESLAITIVEDLANP